MAGKQNVEEMAAELKRLRSQIDELKLQKMTDALHSDVDLSQFPTFRPSKELQGHFGKIYAMHWSQDSQHLCSASQDGKLMIWDGYTTNKRHMINLRSSWVMTCAYAPSGRFVACGGLDNLCSIYPVCFENAETHERPKYELSRHDGYLSCCRFLNDENILTSSGDGTIILWNIETQSSVDIFRGHTADVMSIAINEDELNKFVSGSCDQESRIWDVREGNRAQQIYTGHTSDINSVQWFPNNNSFGSGSDDATVRLFDTRAYAQINKYEDEEVRCGVTSIDFSKTGKYTFTGYDDNPFCAAWSTVSGQIFQKLDAQNSRVSCLGIPKSGYCLCTGSWDNNLHIWTSQ